MVRLGLASNLVGLFLFHGAYEALTVAAYLELYPWPFQVAQSRPWLAWSSHDDAFFTY
jgi:hypothetical protein